MNFETTLKERLESEGYEVLRYGYPDFCAVKRDGGDIKVRFIEAKAKGDRLRPSQISMHAIFGALGLPVEVEYERPPKMRKLAAPKAKVPREPRVNGGQRGRHPKAIDLGEVRRRRKRGESLRRIAKALGVSHSTLLDHLQKSDLLPGLDY